MNIEEMKNAMEVFCNNRADCTDVFSEGVCPLAIGENNTCIYSTKTDDEIIKCYETIFGKVEEALEAEPTPPINDVINKPNHYCREDAMECIDEMKLIFGTEVVKHFCLCNIWKYRYRSASKNGEEDIKKSDRYVQIYKELCSNE